MRHNNGVQGARRRGHWAGARGTAGLVGGAGWDGMCLGDGVGGGRQGVPARMQVSSLASLVPRYCLTCRRVQEALLQPTTRLMRQSQLAAHRSSSSSLAFLPKEKMDLRALMAPSLMIGSSYLKGTHG